VGTVAAVVVAAELALVSVPELALAPEWVPESGSASVQVPALVSVPVSESASARAMAPGAELATARDAALATAWVSAPESVSA